MNKKLKITESRLETLGYVKFNETEEIKCYALDENIFSEKYGLNCDTIWELNIVLHKNGGCVMDGECEIENFNELRHMVYSTFYSNGLEQILD
jgi:hypothetical protein